jgi:hypothetical protein
MTVMFDWHSDWTCPPPPKRCSFCRRRIEPPFVHWQCSGGRDLCICIECCDWCQHGLTADMMRAARIRRGLRALPNIAPGDYPH